jgi:hypothetical protein
MRNAVPQAHNQELMRDDKFTPFSLGEIAPCNRQWVRPVSGHPFDAATDDPQVAHGR